MFRFSQQTNADKFFILRVIQPLFDVNVHNASRTVHHLPSDYNQNWISSIDFQNKSQISIYVPLSFSIFTPPTHIPFKQNLHVPSTVKIL